MKLQSLQKRIEMRHPEGPTSYIQDTGVSGKRLGDLIPALRMTKRSHSWVCKHRTLIVPANPQFDCQDTLGPIWGRCQFRCKPRMCNMTNLSASTYEIPRISTHTIEGIKKSIESICVSVQLISLNNEIVNLIQSNRLRIDDWICKLEVKINFTTSFE